MTERQLIRKIRQKVESAGCACEWGESLYRTSLCWRCTVMKMIDDGLAEIGQTDKEMMANDGHKIVGIVRNL